MTTPPDLSWHRSTRCTASSCVEVAATRTTVYVRDTKDPDREPLEFTHDQWEDFTEGVRRGDFPD